MANEVSQYIRIHSVELQHHDVEFRAMLIIAINIDVNKWLADVAALGTNV